MAKSKVEKTLRDTISTINDLRRELKKVRKAGEKTVAQQFERATKSSSSEIRKVRDELAQVRDTTAKQIADLTAMVARLAPDLRRSTGETKPAATATPPAPGARAGETPVEGPHGDPLGEAATRTTPAPKASAKVARKSPAKRPATSPAAKADPAPEDGDKLSFAGEALAASTGSSPVDPEVPGTVSTAAKKSPAKNASAVKKTQVKKTSAEKPAKKGAQTDAKLSFQGESLAAAAGVSPVDEDAPGTAPTAGQPSSTSAKNAGTKKAPTKKDSTKKATATKAPAKKTAAKKAPKKTPGAKPTAQREGSGGQKTTARKAPVKKVSNTTPPAATPQNPAVADRPAAD